MVIRRRIMSLVFGLVLVFSISSAGLVFAAGEQDASVGLVTTGLFHGEISLDNIEKMIYYYEKIGELSDDGKFAVSITESIKEAKKAYEALAKAIAKAKEGLAAKGQ